MSPWYGLICSKLKGVVDPLAIEVLEFDGRIADGVQHLTGVV